MKGWILFLQILSLLLLPEAGRAESIPDATPSCRVFLDGEELTAVYETAVCHQRSWTAEPALSTTPVAVAVHDGPCRVEIVPGGGSCESALVRPLAAGIRAEVRDGTVAFDLPGAGNYTVEFNGRPEGALHLFISGTDRQKPDPEDPKVRWFGPGEHRDQMITVRNGETIYLAEGCILYGQIYCGMGKNFTIAGPGVLCGSIYDRYKDTLVPVNLSNCSHFAIRDITILDPSAWTVNLYKCRDAEIDNVKIVSARSNSDGFTFQNCEKIRVRNCFVRSWDDSLVVKGYGGDVREITFEDCTLWTDLAQCCEIGYETRAKVIEDITFRNITVLHAFHKPVISIHNSDSAKVRRSLFENILVEDARMGLGDGTPYLIDFTTLESQWSATLKRGTIEDVTVRNVEVLSGKRPSIRIWSCDESSRISHVTISGLKVCGEEISSFDQVDYEASPYNGEDIILEPWGRAP